MLSMLEGSVAIVFPLNLSAAVWAMLSQPTAKPLTITYLFLAKYLIELSEAYSNFYNENKIFRSFFVENFNNRINKTS